MNIIAVEKHEGEDMGKIEFGMRTIKEARSAFERQIAESVLIQNKKRQNYILNSKSEYNRCALPRLTAKLGNISLDDLDKKKREEKETERQWAAKVRELKVKRSKNRREMMSEMTMPAEKRRKMDINKYVRVIQHGEKPEKRTNRDNGDREPTTKPDSKKPKLTKETSEQTIETEQSQKIENPEEPSNWEDAEEVKERWNRMLEERERTMKLEETERTARLKKAEKLAKSWHLLNLCREVMGKEGENWKISKERRDQERQKEEEKHERLGRAALQKRDTIQKIKCKEIQQKITKELTKLPRNRRIMTERAAEKERLMLLKEAKQELWRKWRQKKRREEEPR